MLSLLLLVTSSFITADDFSARVAEINRYASALPAISVESDAAAEKEARLKALQEKIAGGVTSEEGYGELYRSFDATRTWLFAHALQKPTLRAGNFVDAPEAWRITTPTLTFEWNKADLSMMVTMGGVSWRFLPSDEEDLAWADKKSSLAAAKIKEAVPFQTGYGNGMSLRLAEFDAAPGLEFRITVLAVGTELVFDIAATDPGAGWRWMDWPKAVETGASAEEMAVIPRMQGMLLPGNWPKPIHEADLCNSRSFYMPWWGHLRDGHGMMGILETSTDAGGAYDHPAGGPTRIHPRWYATLGRFGYLRTVRYCFFEKADYVTLAKRYRREVTETGRFVSLKEKLTRTPALNEVIGRPVVHVGALYHFVPEAALYNKEKPELNHGFTTFAQIQKGLEDLKERGIDSAYVHLDGWGYYGYDDGHPDVIPVGAEQGGSAGMRDLADRCAAMGYFFAVHDQYRDFYKNAVSFDDRLTTLDAAGHREEGSTWCGGPQTILSPRFAADYVRRNHDYFVEQGIKVRGAYLDVFSIVPLEESFQPTQPVSRAECAMYRRNCFDVLRARGYVVSSEEPTDYLAGSLDLVHHGPYATYPHIGGGEASGIPVPLWNLVYHDSLMLPWDMGEDGGWGTPKGDSGRLHCFLNAGMPYVSPGASEEAIGQTKEAAALQKRCAFSEMVSHKFLDGNFRKQESAYSDGTTVIVDFDRKIVEIQPPVL